MFHETVNDESGPMNYEDPEYRQIWTALWFDLLIYMRKQTKFAKYLEDHNAT